ncbi:glucose 1-dehydrogenase [Luteolibacter sp. LG18]|uniref:SDR family NAD(P)-dependent oxidoreductase n=1 Tax=Luteolibacter sp. LG18 TaxID=2819286 RepID=UPI002B2E8E52|nr:oxidoreductase [Luteolibacter sp. LG18]
MSTSTGSKLQGKTAIVTGASKGIGASIARLLAAEGAAVVVNYASSREGADRVVAEITAAGGKAVAVQADVSKQEDITRLVAESVAAHGPIDILVNNAGIYEMAPLEEITAESFQRQFGLNVLGLLLTTQEAAKQFNPAGGSVINISSVVSTYAPAGSAIYSGTKGAVDTITRVLSKELGGRGIRVNAINPGMVDTEGTRSAGIATDESEFRKHLEATTPLGRIGRPDDIGSAAVFLASDDSSWVTGELFYVAGGLR